MRQQDVNQLLEQAQHAAGGQGDLASTLGGGMPEWMPPAAVIVALGALCVGAIIWLFGGKLIKPGFILVGGVIGSAIGAVYVPMITATMLGIPSAYPGMMIGLVLGMIAAVIVYRFAMASLTAGVVGSAAVLGGIITLSYFPGAIPPSDAISNGRDRGVITADGTDTDLRTQVEDQVRDWSGRLKDAAQKYKDAQLLASASKDPASAGNASAALGLSGDPDQQAADKERIEAAKRTAQAISDHVAERWQALPERSRLIIAATWMAGAMTGFLMGLILPNKAAAAVSSLTGAAMILAGGISLADRYTSLGPSLAGISAMGWLGGWMALSAVGLLFQSRKKAKPTLASEQPPK